MKVVPFHREHLNLIDARKQEAEGLMPYLNDAFLQVAEGLPHNYSMVEDGKIITCMGLLPMWDGVYEVWQIPSIYVEDYIKSYCKNVLGLLDSAAEKLDIWRMQTKSPADDLHDRWMKFIGFECEGTLKKYSRFGKDYRMWRRIYGS